MILSPVQRSYINSQLRCCKLANLLLVLMTSTVLGSGTQPATQCNVVLSRSKITSISVPSDIYGKPVAANVYLPPCYGTNATSLYPVFYLLHGGGADQSQWLDLNVQTAADALIVQSQWPFIVVMPGDIYSGSINDVDFIINELRPAVEAQFLVGSSRSYRGIAGLSLGGYLALQVAFLHPDLFAMVGGYSPVVNRPNPSDPLALMHRTVPPLLQSMPIELDVGDQDSLAYDVRLFAQTGQGRGLAITLTVGHGGHLRSYWRSRTADHLRFFLNALQSCTTCF